MNSEENIGNQEEIVSEKEVVPEETLVPKETLAPKETLVPKDQVFLETKMSTWLRTFNITFGLIQFIAAFIIILFKEIDPYIVIIFSSLILLIGLFRLANGFFDNGLKVSGKILKIVVGSILTVLGILSFFAEDIGGEGLFIIFIASAMILNALTRLVIVVVRKKLPTAVRILLLVLALLMLALAIIVLLEQFLGFLPALAETQHNLLIGILAMTIQFSGIGRLISGISGFRLTTMKTEEEYQKQQKLKKEKKARIKQEGKIRKEQQKAKK